MGVVSNACRRAFLQNHARDDSYVSTPIAVTLNHALTPSYRVTKGHNDA